MCYNCLYNEEAGAPNSDDELPVHPGTGAAAAPHGAGRQGADLKDAA